MSDDPHHHCWQRFQQLLDENDKLRRQLQKLYVRDYQHKRSAELWRHRALRRG